MKIRINGQIKSIELGQEKSTLTELINQLGHHPRLIVVEFNGTILTPESWQSQEVNDGDSLEIVTIVGGGS